jgi:4-aminobutyrate aminotransferase
MYAALDAGLSFKTTMGNVLTLTPPLTITPDEMQRALTILGNAIKSAAPSRS